MKIVALYQSLLGIYGDRGNVTVLAQRLRWRKLPVEVVQVEPGDAVPSDGDLYVLGGGEDKAQISALQELRRTSAFSDAVAGGAHVFAVCAGYQILGTSFTIGDDDTITEGLGMLDVVTRRGPRRAVGEILTEWTRPDGSTSLITGFENHGGYTELGPDARPLARVLHGIGNANTGIEGAQQDRIIGTYPHGPVLARNPDLADHLLTTVLQTELEPLDVPGLERLRAQRIHAARR